LIAAPQGAILQLGGLVVELTTPHCKNKFVMKSHKEPQTSMDSLDKRPGQQNMDKRFGKWNIRSFYREGSLITLLRKLSRYECGGSAGRAVASNQQENTHFAMERGMRTMNWVLVFFGT
jgi:hypothetical protein